jgi:hypothetical protein
VRTVAWGPPLVEITRAAEIHSSGLGRWRREGRIGNSPTPETVRRCEVPPPEEETPRMQVIITALGTC